MQSPENQMVKWESLDIVRMDGENAVTDSITIAGLFKKDHARVLKDIRNLLKNEEVEAEGNFALGEYLDANSQKRPMYKINRDGFSLLAFGWQGKEAIRFKLAFLKAFKRMEDCLTKIMLQGMNLAYENQNKALIGTVREQECIIHDQNRAISSLKKQAEDHKVVHEFGDFAQDGRLKTEYRRPTHTVARSISQMQRTIKQLNSEMEQMRFYGLHMEDINADGTTGY